MDSDISLAQPNAAAMGERQWFGNLVETQDPRIKRPGPSFAARRHGELNVIDADKAHAARRFRPTPAAMRVSASRQIVSARYPVDFAKRSASIKISSAAAAHAGDQI